MTTRVANDGVNKEILDRMDKLRLEFKQDLNAAISTVSTSQGRLEQKFDNLEAGRLTRAEGNINDLRLDLQRVINQFDKKASREKEVVSTLSAKFVIIYSIIGAVFVAIVTALAYKVLNGAGGH
jgi:hypothetical protein